MYNLGFFYWVGNELFNCFILNIWYNIYVNFLKFELILKGWNFLGEINNVWNLLYLIEKNKF